MIPMQMTPVKISRAEFDKLFQELCNWGRWGADDERGTLNYIMPEHVCAATALVRTGQSVSLALPMDTVAGPDNPRPSAHYMVQLHDIGSERGEPQFAGDYLASEIHGNSRTHIDALRHIAYNGMLYNGKPSSSVTSQGPPQLDVAVYAQGIVGKGVLLDIPRLRGVKWLEPGDGVSYGELLQAEAAQGVRLGAGDILLFRTGHHRRRLEMGPWDNGYEGEGRAGLYPEALRLLHERKVAAFLPDGDGETIPSNVDGVSHPIHALQIAAMGMACADNLQFEEAIEVCERERRWEFLLVTAPLRIPRGTGSLVNPLAIF